MHTHTVWPWRQARIAHLNTSPVWRWQAHWQQRAVGLDVQLLLTEKTKQHLVGNICLKPSILFSGPGVGHQSPGKVPLDSSRNSSLFWSIYVCGAPIRCGTYPNLPWDNLFLMLKTNEFTRPPNPGVPVETKKTRNASRSRVHRISAGYAFSKPHRNSAVPQLCFCGEPLVRLQNTEVLLS